MSQEVMIAGAVFSDVPSIRVPDSNNVFHSFIDVTDTTATASDVASGKYFYAADGTRTAGTSSGGGGGIGTLLATQALGNIQTSSTSATDTGLTVTVNGVNPYDLLIVEISVDEEKTTGHLATVRMVALTASTSIGTKTGSNMFTGTWNCRKSNNGIDYLCNYNATATGVYPQSPALDNGKITLSIYKKYSGTYTTAIDNNYTARVYGVNLYDLIGG